MMVLFYIPDDFLPGIPLFVDISYYNYGCLFLLSVLYIFASHVINFCCLVHTHLGLLCWLGEWALLSLYNVALSLVLFFALKSTLSDISMLKIYSRFRLTKILT